MSILSSIGKPSAASDEEIWRVFTAPRTDEEFCQAWLALLCGQLHGVTAGVVLWQSAEAGTFVPVAVWPAAPRDLSFLSKAAERALIEARGVVHHPEEGAGGNVHIAYPVEIAQRILGGALKTVGFLKDLGKISRWSWLWEVRNENYRSRGAAH